MTSEPTNPVNPPGGLGGSAAHATTVAEKGSFATAHCSCGWHSPARRSRDKARKDAAAHLVQDAG